MRLEGSVIGQLGSTSTGVWYEIDITAAVRFKIGQIMSIAVDETDADGMDFYSRESANKPTLIVNF